MTIFWQPKLQIDVTFVGGESERLVGDRKLAAKLAARAGLGLAPTPLGTVRWTKDSTFAVHVENTH